MRGGWIKLHRQLLDKAIWHESTPEQKVILITLLMMANHEEKEWEWKGQKYKAKPGQFITSLPQIAKECGKGITVQNVRTALKRFEKYDFLTDESTNRNRLITIKNWGFYQARGKELTDNLTGNQQAANRQLTANKNDKNDKNNIYTVDFEEFWSAYPKRINNPKKDAFKPWNARLKEGVEPKQLIKAAQGYKRYCEHEGLESRHILQAKTFLGPAERWQDWLDWKPPAPQQTMGKEVPGGGVPNAGAYKPVDLEAVKRWKELNKDDYEDD